MSTSLSPRKGKRSRSDSENNDCEEVITISIHSEHSLCLICLENKPFFWDDSTSSFVKNVTSRMSGLLPATITRWFSSSSSSNTNGSTVVESTDSSTEDEANDGLRTPNQRTQPSQPPAKRMRFSTPGTSSYYVPETKSTSTNTDTTDTYSTLQSPSKDAFKLEANYVSTPSCSPSEASSVNENEKEPSIYIYQDPMTSMNTSVGPTRKSIFGTEERIKESCARTAANTYKDLSQPYFKPGLLCTPFYTSRPVYGGPHTSYMNQTNIKHKSKAIVHNSSNSNSINISNSAKRIMDLLENYSSPVIEARRISRLVNSSSDKTLDNSFNNSSNTANSSKGGSYKKQELHVPSFASILQLKQKSRLMDTTSTARQIIASHSSSLHSMLYPASTSSGTNQNKETSQEKLITKMKARVTRVNREDKAGSEVNLLPVVDLPTAVLQIDKNNLPKFSLDTPVSNTTGNKQKTVELLPTATNTISPVSKIVLSKPEPPKDKPIDMPDGKTYTFSIPIRISNDSVVTSTESFTFGSPKRSVEQSKGQVTDDSGTTSVEGEGKQVVSFQPVQIIKSNKILVCNNSDSQNKLEAAKACNDKPSIKKCSECKTAAVQLSSDKCFDCDKKANSVVKLDSKVSQSASRNWKCQDCWVNNDVGVDKCVCCGAKNSNISKHIPTNNLEKPKETWKCRECLVFNDVGIERCVCCGAKNLIGTRPPKMMLNSTWKCQECWVDNKEDKDNCVCCGAKNFSALKPLPKIPKINTGVDWICDECLLKNKFSNVQCVACGTLKPLTKENHYNSSLPKSNSTTNINNDSLLKNIVKKQSDQWECPSCFVRNENNQSKCACCETEKPGITKESEKKSFNFAVTSNSSFKFGIDTRHNATENNNKSKAALIFGNSTNEVDTNKNHIAKAPSFTFGIQNKKPGNEITNEVNKISEIPKVGFAFVMPKDGPTSNAAPAFKINTEIFKPLTVQPDVADAITANDSERAQEVPSVDKSKLRASEPAQKITGLFNMASSNEAKPIPALKAFNSSFTAESTAGLTLTTASNTIVSSNVSFSITGNQPANNIFSSPAPATSPNTFACTPAPAVPSTMFQKESSSPSMSFFQKTEPALSLFDKNESAVTTASVSVLPSAPVFSFGKGAPAAAPANEQPGFNFNFGRDNKPEAPSMFKLPFGGPSDNSATNNFMMPASSINSSNMLTGNNLGGNNGGNNIPHMLTGGNNNNNNNPLSGLTTGNGLTSGNLMNTLTQNLSMESNSMSNNAPAASADMFAPVQKENMWSSGNNNTQTTMFGANDSSNNLQKRPFTFGGAAVTSKPFGSVASSPFDIPNQPKPMFGISNQPSSMFGNAAPSPMAPSMFGSPQPSNLAPVVGMFGNANVPANQPPAFGMAMPSFPAFDSPNINQPMNSTPTPTFNFGAQQQSSGIFGFGQQQPQQQQLQHQQQLQQQQQQQQQQPQQGVYNFGGGAPQVQFTVGSAPNTAGRRVRKAFRRTQR